MLKLLDLFSGIGGFSLGMEATKQIKTIGFVEKDKFCQKVLRKNFKNVPIEEEIKNVKGSKYTADIISGGFPCQPFSVAGKRKGTEDDRYLWDEMLRVITEVKPRWVVGENVQGLININNGLVLRQVQTDLEAQGFEVQCFLIPASGIGAWHQRKRVWIIAYSNNNGHSTQGFSTSNKNKTEFRISGNNPTKKYDVSNTDKRDVEARRERQWGVCKESKRQRSSSNATSIRKTLSNTNSFRHRGWSSEGCANGKWSFFPRKQEGREVGSEAQRCDDTTSNSNSEGSQGYGVSTDMETKQRQVITERSIEEQQTWWEAQSKLCGVPNGVCTEFHKDRANRIKALGNSIVPQIAYEIGQAILKAEYE